MEESRYSSGYGLRSFESVGRFFLLFAASTVLFFYIGAQPAGKAYPHHHPKFDIREEAMMKAARAMTVATLTCLAEKEMK